MSDNVDATSQLGLATGQSARVRMSEIDHLDTTFQYRHVIRVEDLKKSLATSGQRMPVTLRRGALPLLQIISGFRRLEAMRQLGWSHVNASIHDDLTDQDAYLASVLENTARKSYSDVDRALALQAGESVGVSTGAAESVMALSARQRRNIRSLLKMSDAVRAAVDDPEHSFTTSHALILRRFADEPEFDESEWIRIVRERDVSVVNLKRRLRRRYREGRLDNVSCLDPRGTDLAEGKLRFRPTPLDLASLSETERRGLREELLRLADLCDPENTDS